MDKYVYVAKVEYFDEVNEVETKDTRLFVEESFLAVMEAINDYYHPNIIKVEITEVEAGNFSNYTENCGIDLSAIIKILPMLGGTAE